MLCYHIGVPEKRVLVKEERTYITKDLPFIVSFRILCVRYVMHVQLLFFVCDNCMHCYVILYYSILYYIINQFHVLRMLLFLPNREVILPITTEPAVKVFTEKNSKTNGTTTKCTSRTIHRDY